MCAFGKGIKQMPRIRRNELLGELQVAHIQAAFTFARSFLSPNEFYRAVRMTRPSRSYFAKSGAEIFSLKAIVTAACQSFDSSFVSTNFNAAAGARRLTQLGFDVVHLSNVEEAELERVERQRVEATRLARPEQAKFRVRLIEAFGGKCAITGCTALDAVDAAHIKTVTDAGDDSTGNGILLRVDLHRLFDCNLLAIDPSNQKAVFAEACRSSYQDLHGKKVKLPKNASCLTALRDRWQLYLAAN
jgi:HNH endonuclease